MLPFQLATQGGRVSRKLKAHMSSVWNWMDLTGIFFFWLPFILRFFHLNHSEDVARLFYIFDLFFWYMRILNIFTVSKRLGPVVTIILNMVRVQLNEKRRSLKSINFRERLFQVFVPITSLKQRLERVALRNNRYNWLCAGTGRNKSAVGRITITPLASLLTSR